MSVRILQGDCREVMRGMDAESVDCVVTSPPYWGLRDYGVSGQLGMEPTMAEHIATMVDVFREVRRILKPTGTVWLNYGDCYSSHAAGVVADPMKKSTLAGVKTQTIANESSRTKGTYRKTTELAEKQLCMIPNRLAIALQEDGWWVRSEIIWAKPNPMPESVTDRPSSSHEKVFLLTKSARYFYDAEAVRTPPADEQMALGANLRNVWTVPTKPFSEAHFATFPPDLIVPCIKAGCPKDGTVLDPFGGSGTTGLVADRLGRNAILIELNPDYIEMAKRRVTDDAPLFAEVA